MAFNEYPRSFCERNINSFEHKINNDNNLKIEILNFYLSILKYIKKLNI
jgi:hypothetical protein